MTAPREGRSLPVQLATILFVGFPLIVLALGAMALPAALSYDLVVRGARESHPSWIVLGGAIGALWLFALGLTMRKYLRRPAGG